MSEALRSVDLRMHDGSRHFGGFPECLLAEPDWFVLRDAINNQQGEWWCFVQDPTAPDELLRRVLTHFAEALREA